MTLEEAMKILKEGKKVRRDYWRKDTYIYMNSNGEFITQSGRPFEIILNELYDLEDNNWEIWKEKKKVKLRDITKEQYRKWKDQNCKKYNCHKTCPFGMTECNVSFWINFRGLYSDAFLDQELELEIEE